VRYEERGTNSQQDVQAGIGYRVARVAARCYLGFKRGNTLVGVSFALLGIGQTGFEFGDACLGVSKHRCGMIQVVAPRVMIFGGWLFSHR
jgi:hypothetical protein